MHVERLQLSQLRLLEALASEGNLSMAASRVGLSQPAASHALSRLRRDLADPLFVRTSRGLRATPYGRQVVDAAHKALLALRSGLAQSQFVPSTSNRVFTLYMSDVGQMVLLPRLLARVHAEAPHVSLRVRSIPERSPHVLLETGEVDLAIGYINTLTTGFYQKRLFKERYVCVVRHDHPAFSNGMSLKAFKSVPHALADATGMAHEVLEAKLRRYGIRRPVKLYVPQFVVLPLVVPNSDLLVVMPGRLAENFSRLLPLKIMALPVTVPPYDIKIYWHERFRLDPSNLWLRNVFVELFGND